MRESKPQLGRMTLEEYVAFESGAARRHEFVAGHVYLMSGTSARHNEIAININARLRAAARGGPCKAYLIDLKVRTHDRVYYPDGVVVSTPHDGDALIFDEPCLVVEVTSRSTRRIDRGEKLDAYLRIPSLRGYLIAEHNRRHVTVYAREPRAEWTAQEIVTSGTMALPCPATTLSLDEIYEGVELPPLRVGEDVDDEAEWMELEEN